MIIVFVLLFGVGLLYVWSSKAAKERRERKAAKMQTEGLLQTYANAAKALVEECGYERVSGGEIPKIFTNDPGWAGWRGSYVRGDVRGDDYYGTPIKFLFSNGVFTQISAGLDRKLGTSDDLSLETPLINRQNP